MLWLLQQPTEQCGGVASGVNADDIAVGDAAVVLGTSAGNITIDAQGNDTDIIFKGTDNNNDTTFLTLDGSDAGTAIFNHDIKMGTNDLIKLGDDSDFTIHHDGTNSIIRDVNGHNTWIQTDGHIYLTKKFGSKFHLIAYPDAAVELRYNNTKRFETTNTGAAVVGNLSVSGTLSATTKSFDIKHPTKEGMKLRYGSLEGPENGVYVRGRLKGNHVINLPDYWTGLVDEDSITVSLTPVGNHQGLYVESIENNMIFVGGEGSHYIDCFYVVYGERKDVDKITVEYNE